MVLSGFNCGHDCQDSTDQAPTSPDNEIAVAASRGEPEQGTDTIQNGDGDVAAPALVVSDSDRHNTASVRKSVQSAKSLFSPKLLHSIWQIFRLVL